MRLLQAAGGFGAGPAEVALGSEQPTAPAWLPGRERVQAGLALLSMFVGHVASDEWSSLGSAAGSSSSVMPTGGLPAAALRQHLVPGAAGVQQQVTALLAYVSQQQRLQPEVYCMEAELLSRAC
jgi:hypothetical protein